MRTYTEVELRNSNLSDEAFYRYRRELQEFVQTLPEGRRRRYNAAFLTWDIVADYRKTWEFRRGRFINFITDAATNMEQLQKTENESRLRLREKLSREDRGEYIDRLALVRGEINRRNGSKQ